MHKLGLKHVFQCLFERQFMYLDPFVFILRQWIFHEVFRNEDIILHDCG